jgi:hypothetical protein
MGFCPHCGIEALLYAPSPDIAIASIMATGMLTSATRSMSGKHICTLCELMVSQDARSIAIHRGYLWFLIGKVGSEEQAAINRTLWRAARQARSTYQEASRAALRATLAQQPPERGFQEASAELTGAEKDIATKAVDELIGVNGRVKNDEKQRRALIGTIGMHHVLLAAERRAVTPAWLGNQRYFLTGSGMECLARNLPLGRRHDPPAGQEKVPAAV